MSATMHHSAEGGYTTVARLFLAMLHNATALAPGRLGLHRWAGEPASGGRRVQYLGGSLRERAARDRGDSECDVQLSKAVLHSFSYQVFDLPQATDDRVTVDPE
jgi:hypothetical protein